MPFMDVDGCRLNVEVAGPADAPVLMLSVFANTSCHYPIKDPWNERISAAAASGLAPLLDAGHISNIEQAPAFTAEVMGFLTAP
jgi:hypothetical protein